jgi:nicotinamide phosphoribosyltransferase
MHQTHDTSFHLFAPTATDGYKVGHRPLYPDGTNFTYSNGTYRSDRLFVDNKSKSRFWDGKIVNYGLQGVMREINGLWHNSFFSKPKEAVCKRYARRMKYYLGDNRVDVKCFEELHDLGYLPLVVLGLPEGERVNINVPTYVTYNTHPAFYWLVNYLETMMSALLWKMTTNATIAYEYRRTFEYWADKTGVDRSFVDIQGHDFSFRGLSGPEDAARVGSAHQIVFKGTDTLPAIDYVEDMYGANVEKEFVACSVVATEHAVATSNILFNVSKLLKQIHAHYPNDKIGLDMDELRAQGERKFIFDVLTKKHPTGVVSLVSDSFDFWKVITEIAASLKNEILARQPDEMGLAKVVFRPDSGDPVEILAGRYVHSKDDFLRITSSADEMRDAPRDFLVDFGGGEIVRAVIEGDERLDQVYITARYNGYCIVPLPEWPLTPQEQGAVQVLWDIFGGTKTSLGYKVLHERVGLIYGDSITVERADEILRRLYVKGFASCNTVFGIGSYTYQHNTRDTFGFAVKATAVRVEDEVIELFKAPKTEGVTNKKSAKGFLKVVKNERGDFVKLEEQQMAIQDIITSSGELRAMYVNGAFPRPTTYAEVCERLKQAA